jgi:hypothetical protein
MLERDPTEKRPWIDVATGACQLNLQSESAVCDRPDGLSVYGYDFPLFLQNA